MRSFNFSKYYRNDTCFLAFCPSSCLLLVPNLLALPCYGNQDKLGPGKTNIFTYRPKAMPFIIVPLL